jgi:ferric enterobactin receptor
MLKKLAFFLLISIGAMAQNAIDLSGNVVDSLTKEPLSFATIKIEKNGILEKGILSSENGSFKIDGLSKSKYLIKIEYVGYTTKIIEVNAAGEIKNLNLGALSLSPLSQLLENLIITGVKPNMVTTLEKQVFDSELFEVAKGGTATDVIKNIPSVMVNAEGEIIIRGSKGFVVMVNGKPSAIDQATLLSQISANSILKIEVISVPGAKYEADGKAGIINIITKKGATDGLSVFANLQYGLPRFQTYYNEVQPNRYGADATVSFRKDKLEINTSINYLQNDIAGKRIGDAFTILNNVKTSFPSVGERSFKRESYGFRGNMSYSFNSNNEFSAGVYFGQKEQYRKANITYDNQKTNPLNGEIISSFAYYNPNLVLKSGNFKVYNLDFTHRFLDKSSLSFSALSENAQLDGYTKNRNLNINDHSDMLQYTLNTGKNPLQALRLKLDYEKPLSVGTIAFGYQYREQNQSGIFEYLEKKGNNLPFIRIDDFSADIRVQNTIHAAYAMFNAKINKVELSSGLRYENALRVFQDFKNADGLLRLSNLFPSANIMYALPNDFRLKAGYSRRVQRSTNNELNPYPEREHSETLEQGDPQIRPEFVGMSEIGLAKDFKKVSAYLNVYHQHITDIVNRVNSAYNDTILNRIYTNAGVANLIGTELGFTWGVSKKIKWFAGGNVYNLNIKGSLFDNQVAVNSKGCVYSLNSNINYKITPTLNTQFNLTYLSARNTAQGEDSRFYQPNLTLKKTFLENKISLGAQWQNMAFGSMAVNQQRITTFGSNFYTTTNYIQETNIVMLNLSYNFNQKEKKIKLPNSEFGEKEF